MLAMTLLAAFVALCGCGLGWLMVRGNPDRRAWILGCTFAGLGLLAGWWIYSTDQRQRRETLYEVMAEGSVGIPVGVQAPVRRLEFLVKHPQVEHTLMIKPSSYRAGSPSGSAELSFRLLDPEGQTLIEDKRVYAVRSGGRSAADWEGAYFPFRPAKTGQHVLEVTILTVGIPHLHIRVADPANTDGVRIPGF
jgi:hypothetical protein